MEEKELRQRITELEDKLAELTLSREQTVDKLAFYRGRSRGRSTVNGESTATGYKDRTGVALYFGDRVRVLTKSTRTAEFYGVTYAKITGIHGEYLNLVSLDHKASRKEKRGKRKSHNVKREVSEP